uniref:SH3 and cysteine rich domain 2 n=1 Tax=Poecilia latipinna TaxID=48699 RepID=A0A3B3UXG7_9TELE
NFFLKQVKEAVKVLKKHNPFGTNSKLFRNILLKRSLSFKTMMRSKSMENFFQRSYSDARLPADFITDPPPPSPPLPPGSPLVGERSPSISPSLISLSLWQHQCLSSVSLIRCLTLSVGNSKQALRCKTCKMAAHLWCTSELSQQQCHGKSGAFKRNFSSPMLVNEQLAVVKEVQPKAARMRVDPVYAALRYGTSLAQMSRSSFGSLSESPTRSLVRHQLPSNVRCLWQLGANILLFPLYFKGEGGEERQERQCSMEEEITQETGVHSIHTYVALYRFLPQELNDLELHGDRVGFFPANFVQRVRPGERVWRVVQSVPGNREKGHMAVRESQICVGKREDGETFLKLSSGKKRGLVPADSIEEI